MALVSLEEAKANLRVDSSYEDDTVIIPLIRSAESFCMEVARLDQSEWDAVVSGEYGDTVTIRGEERDADEVAGWPGILRQAVLCAMAYMYEHREETDYHSLAITLRNLLFSIREGVF